jgi:hypothetical protein
MYGHHRSRASFRFPQWWSLRSRLEPALFAPCRASSDLDTKKPRTMPGLGIWSEIRSVARDERGTEIEMVVDAGANDVGPEADRFRHARNDIE